MTMPRVAPLHYSSSHQRLVGRTRGCCRWRAAVVALAAILPSFVTIFRFHQDVGRERQLEQVEILLSVLPSRDEFRRKQSSKVDRNDILPLHELTDRPKPGSIKCNNPHLKPVYDRIILDDSNNNSTRTKIPKILHISYNSRCLPLDLWNAVAAWKRALPDHSVYFHDNASVERLLQNAFSEFPHLRLLQQCLQRGAMTIDLWRMLVIYRYGGLYADIDVLPGNGMLDDGDSIHNTTNTTTDFYYFHNSHSKHYATNIHPHVTFVSGSDGRNRPTQWLFAAAPKHAILYFTIHEILANVQHIPSLSYPKPVHTTGPEALRAGYEHYISVAVKRWQTQQKEERRRKNGGRRRKKHGNAMDDMMKRLQEDPLASGVFGTSNGINNDNNAYFLAPYNKNNNDHRNRPHYIQKLSHRHTDAFGIGNLGNTYNDIVQYPHGVGLLKQQDNVGDNSSSNTTTTMTRRERVELLSGIVHWQKQIYRNQGRQHQQQLDISCMEHLYSLS